MTKITKNPRFTKYELCNLYILQNKSLSVLKSFVLFQSVLNFRKYFGVFGLFWAIYRYFEYRIRNLRIRLYMGTWVKCIFEHLFEHFQNKSKNVPEV